MHCVYVKKYPLLCKCGNFPNISAFIHVPPKIQLFVQNKKQINLKSVQRVEQILVKSVQRVEQILTKSVQRVEQI